MVRHGDYIAKMRFAPNAAFAKKRWLSALDLASAPEVYRPVLVAELRGHPYKLDIQVQKED